MARVTDRSLFSPRYIPNIYMFIHIYIYIYICTLGSETTIHTQYTRLEKKAVKRIAVRETSVWDRWEGVVIERVKGE